VSIHDEQAENPEFYRVDPPNEADSNTSLLADVENAPAEQTKGTRWHGGLDFGLLILRIALGGTIGAHGLQHLFGLFHGSGIDGFARIIGGMGFTSQTTFLAWLASITEVGGSALLLLGLFTPLGAAALLGLFASIVYVKFHGGFFIGQGQGFEFEALLGLVALTFLFTGPGRIALDVNTPWRKKPVPYGLLGVLLAAAVAVVVLIAFR
jgi:putative oxidoreductase